MQIRRFVRKVNILVIVLPLYQRNVAQQIAIAAHSVCMYDELYEIFGEVTMEFIISDTSYVKSSRY